VPSSGRTKLLGGQVIAAQKSKDTARGIGNPMVPGPSRPSRPVRRWAKSPTPRGGCMGRYQETVVIWQCGIGQVNRSGRWPNGRHALPRRSKNDGV